MQVLIIGASRGIGLETVTQALAAGYQVRAFARSGRAIGPADQNLEKVPGRCLEPPGCEHGDRLGERRDTDSARRFWPAVSADPIVFGGHPGIHGCGQCCGSQTADQRDRHQSRRQWQPHRGDSARSFEWRNGMIAGADVADFLVRQIEGQWHPRKDPVLVR